MPCGLDAADCILAHWCPALDARRERAGWRAPCPACGTPRALSIQVKGKRIVWNPHCQCDMATVKQTLSTLLAGCLPGSARRADKSAPDPDELISLALAKMPPQSLRLGLLELAGMNTGDALDKLGIGPTHRGRVIAPLRRAQKLPVSVRKPRSRSLPVSVSLRR